MSDPVVSLIYAVMPMVMQGKVTFECNQPRRLILLRFGGVKIALITATSAEEFEECKVILESRIP